VDEYLNIRQKEIFHNLLANPADAGSVYANTLHELVKSYPQSGLFRALYSRALNDKNPAAAGAYFDSRALFKLYNQPDNLLEVDNSQIILQAEALTTDAPLADLPVPEVETGETEPANETAATTETEPTITDEALAAPKAADDLLKDQPVDFPDILNVSWLVSPEEEASREVAAEEEADEQTATAEEDTAIAEPEPVAETIEAPEELPEPVAEEPAPEPVNYYYGEEEETTAPTEVWDEPVAAEEALIAQEEESPAIAHVEPQQELTPLEDIIAQQYGDMVTKPAPTFTAPVNVSPESHINEEVFDEITGIDDIEIVQNPADISPESVAPEEALVEQEEPVAETAIEPEPAPEETKAAETTEAQPVTDEAEKLILGNIAATDYFVFDKAFGDNKKVADAPASPEPQPSPAPVPEPAFVAMPHEEPAVSEPVTDDAAQHDVSKYHDEKMPYTFMWWLDKTRKEHGSLYQPYTKAPIASPVSQAKNQEPVPDALQQQYFENIFHIASPVSDLADEAAAQTIEFDMQSKEDRIIQRFITEDPHIHPPVGEKLDTENKAKRSSEDSNEMVTETLAKIYADQMLYPKAIATYKKLMLKFPEKSRYFASRIENLEKKTN
jgi:hypothetical protein